jgi:hypothetical protein
LIRELLLLLALLSEKVLALALLLPLLFEKVLALLQPLLSQKAL